MWKKIENVDEGRTALLNNLTITHLTERRWYIAEGLSKFVTNDSGQTEYARMCGLINYWQTFKWSGRFDEVEAQVRAAEFSAKEPAFKLGRFALLGDFEAFFKLLPNVISMGGLDSDSPAIMADLPRSTLQTRDGVLHPKDKSGNLNWR
jgi:hypothetical protein